MHRSRLSGIMIDCSADTMEAGVAFWQQALGGTVRRSEDATSPYVALEGVSGWQIGMQRVHDTQRIHLDIETDNVEAEVQRLETLGARRKAQVDSWWILEAPSGHLFCVVPAQSNTFPAQTPVWET